MKRRRKQRPERPDPLDGLTKTQLAYKLPMRERVIEHLMADGRKFEKAMTMIRALGFKIKVASNEKDFDIVPV